MTKFVTAQRGWVAAFVDPLTGEGELRPIAGWFVKGDEAHPGVVTPWGSVKRADDERAVSGMRYTRAFAPEEDVPPFSELLTFRDVLERLADICVDDALPGRVRITKDGVWFYYGDGDAHHRLAGEEAVARVLAAFPEAIRESGWRSDLLGKSPRSTVLCLMRRLRDDSELRKNFEDAEVVL